MHLCAFMNIRLKLFIPTDPDAGSAWYVTQDGSPTSGVGSDGGHAPGAWRCAAQWTAGFRFAVHDLLRFESDGVIDPTVTGFDRTFGAGINVRCLSYDARDQTFHHWSVLRFRCSINGHN